VSLAPGTRLGSYEIVSALGEGGMGVVYRARDTKLNRDVALKILPETFALDAERRARFTREAQILASLNHPHIAGLYGLEDSGQTHALAMELVDGQDLSEHSQLSIADAISIARQIADALEAAHELGVIHRDLKPANIKVKADGTVKVLDFGLAKAAAGAAEGTPYGSSNSPTMTSPAMTAMGMILGTASYMAPEQAKGRPVDKRADIWAFGIVLYEMLSGRRCFPGDDVTDVLAAVLRQDIDWSALPAATPPRVRQLLERCLDRDVKTRLRDIGEARVLLASPGPAPAADSPQRRGVSIGMTAGLTAIAAIGAALAVFSFRPASTAPDVPVVRLPFEAPAAVISEISDPTISPDGKTMLFSGRGADGSKVLWVRALDAEDATPLPDTDDAIEPFWSWDSKSIAFGANGKLKRLDLGATRAQVLTDAARLNNGAWSRHGDIVFGPDYGAMIMKVAATGGPRSEVVKADSEGRPSEGRYPVFLPDGKHFLFWGGNRTWALSVDGGELKQVLDAGPVVFAPPGWLLYIRNGVVVAHAFDTERLEVSGEPKPIAREDSGELWGRGTRLSVSETGVLVIASPPGQNYQLAWFDRSGKPAGTLGPVRNSTVIEVPRISPDGSRVVVQINDVKTRNQDLWLGDVSRGTFERFTTVPQMEQLPVWSGDGTSVFANASRPGMQGIYRFPIGGGPEELVAPGTLFPANASQDGRWLYFTSRGETTRLDIWAMPLTKDAKPQPVVNSEFDDTSPNVSRDGQWLAYQSDITGIYEIYVRRLTDGRAGPATTVSNGHGLTPRWSRDGRTLFFVSAPQGFLSARMMSVSMTPAGDQLQFGAPATLFNARMMPVNSLTRDYDIAPDGRFLVGTVVGERSRTAAMVVLNWPAIVK